jgi:hypothetical protein
MKINNIRKHGISNVTVQISAAAIRSSTQIDGAAIQKKEVARRK